MSGSPISGLRGMNERPDPYWLPPNAHGNGLTAQRWAAITELPDDHAEVLLSALRAAGVAACAARVHPNSAGDRASRVWVDPEHYGQAENVLLADQATPASAASTHGAATLSEVAHLWWFCDGAIMDGEVREHLWRSRGLCARHAWLYFRTETELRYQPLGNAVLYEDLTGRAARLHASRHRGRHAPRVLESRSSCLTCDHLAGVRQPRASFAADRARVLAGQRTREWLAGSCEVWQAHVCPACEPGAVGVLCRLHIDDNELPDLVRGYLSDLQLRLQRCVKSMSSDGPTREPDSDAALVEALGWFAGWTARPRL